MASNIPLYLLPFSLQTSKCFAFTQRSLTGAREDRKEGQFSVGVWRRHSSHELPGSQRQFTTLIQNLFLDASLLYLSASPDSSEPPT